MGFSSSASTGRDNARITNTTLRLVTVERIENHEVTIPYRTGPATFMAWVVYGNCGHELTRRVSASSVLPGRLAQEFPVGRRKRCPECRVDNHPTHE